MISDEPISILHVDDDPQIVELTPMYMDCVDAEIDVETETDPRAALDVATEERIDCVVSDYDMPGLDGLELYERVSAERDVPFVLFTGKGSEDIASEAISAGVSDYIRKSGSRDTYELLANRVRNLVSKHRAEQRVEYVFEAIEVMSEGVSLIDDGVFTYVNPRYAEIFGYERTELVGSHWSRLYDSETLVDEMESVLENLSATDDAWCGQTRQVRRDGSAVRTEHTLTYTGDGQLVCLVDDPVPMDDGSSPPC